MDVKSNEEVREELLIKALESLKTQAKAVVDEVMVELYCDYLPHVVTDTDSNIGNRVSGVVKNLIAGKFERCGESPMVRVSDNYNSEHYISFNSYDAMAKPLCDLMGPEIVGARVKQLENEVESLKQQLESAYRR
ncbi:hypothetical protein YA0745_12100 [Pseudomonas synxantha]|uniref:Phage protein n=1 Tax=Pseudomonas synxantha TaxID=47883 RepID=A0ABS0UCI4_9PSED|nr:hypothetical protein [Pseudomonas synxantha]MBI6563298.1 hypothetical protein [Pseudomonas synxantha]MBI6582102.1 hypothetical protein [Pseudomonas synxantha]MBI6643677.1 hypothetical protein [Pseudomonas synxantha]